MGIASSHALGLALGRPDKRVIVLDGDGSLLMNLGSLVTIANAAPRNLVHIVCANGTYEANGGHPLPGVDRLDFAGIARAAGIHHVLVVTEFDALEKAIPTILNEPGPVFVVLKIVPGKPSPQDYDYIHSAEARTAFKQALAADAPTGGKS
jgi:thiamine pyrophosphate-dependent acetolactate synthase large subunit-like protein